MRRPGMTVTRLATHVPSALPTARLGASITVTALVPEASSGNEVTASSSATPIPPPVRPVALAMRSALWQSAWTALAISAAYSKDCSACWPGVMRHACGPGARACAIFQPIALSWLALPAAAMGRTPAARADAVTTLPSSCGLTHRQSCLDIFVAAVPAFRVALVIVKLPGRA